MLSSPYEKQIIGLSVLGDYLTEDIANEWIDEDIYLLQELLTKGIVDESVLDIYIKINDNFDSIPSVVYLSNTDTFHHQFQVLFLFDQHC